MRPADLANALKALNPEQREAVETLTGPLLVLAGAGTGKTKVITSRIANLLTHGVRPEQIVAVSFTNKAAKEMGERLAQMVGKAFQKRTILSTFHSFCLRLLREFPEQAGLRVGFSIADEGSSRDLLRETLAEHKLQEIFSLQKAAEHVGASKDALMRVSDFSNAKHLVNRLIIKKVFEDYERRLRLYNLVDFDDIVYRTVLMLRDHPSVREQICTRYNHFLVDEFQDTSNAQFELIRLLGEQHRNVCVVGDDDQSIYAWRGAKPQVLFDFLEIFPETKKVTLEQNYRCSSQILNVANSVISSNQTRLGKTLWSRKDENCPVRLHTAENERDEAIFVSEQIHRLRREENLPWASFTILVRSNAQTEIIEQVFMERKIPYHVHGGSEFFDRKEIRDMLSFLRFANNPKDANALFRVINVPARGIGLRTLEHLSAGFEAAVQSQPHLSFLDYIESVRNEFPAVSLYLEKFIPIHKKMKNALSQTDVANSLRDCFESLGLKQEILSSSRSMQVANWRLNLVDKMLAVIEKVELDRFTLADLVDALNLDDSSFSARKEVGDRVQMMTIHASKGLEFPCVFVVGVEEKRLPHERSMDTPAGVEEERRLFYVALTRAQKFLFLSHCGFRSRGNRSARGADIEASRFLNEVPEQSLLLTETDPATEEAQRLEAAKRLFELFR
ncbi:ATP-dependent helicase [bacterium]|nr:ATP-dependent helicase [bacterium]